MTTSFKTEKQTELTLKKALAIARSEGVKAAKRGHTRRPPYPGASEYAMRFQTAWLEGYDSIIPSQEKPL